MKYLNKNTTNNENTPIKSNLKFNLETSSSENEKQEVLLKKSNNDLPVFISKTLNRNLFDYELFDSDLNSNKNRISKITSQIKQSISNLLYKQQYYIPTTRFSISDSSNDTKSNMLVDHKNGYQSQISTTSFQSDQITTSDSKSVNDNYEIDKSNHESICCFPCLNFDKQQNYSLSFSNRLKKTKYAKISYYRNNLSFFITIIIYLIIQMLLSIIQYHLYLNSNIAVRFARIGGILLDFNSGLIILLVLRRIITWVRNSVIGKNYLPVDDFIKFHKFVGIFILLLSIMHTIAHCINLYWLSDDYKKKFASTTLNIKNGSIISKIITTLSQKNLTDIKFTKLNISDDFYQLNSTNSSNIVMVPNASFLELLFTTKSNIGWVYGTAMPTGWALLFILLVIELFSLPFIRKKGYFQVFYYTHWFHVLYYVLLIIHAKNYWKWFLFPFIFVIFERLFTCFRVQSVKYGDTYIKDVNLLSSKVTQLIIPRPPNFKFRSGDYLYIKVPKIARYEWHPFTISSAPELKDELWLHVRSLGNWTNKLYEYFQNFSKYNRNESLYNPYAKNFASETKYERRMSNLVVMIDYKRNSPENLDNRIKSIAEETKPKKKKKYEKNLNITNNIKNVWMEILIDGPYSTPSRRIFDSEQVILIAGGIGVTPFASILQSLWFKYSKSLKTCARCNNQWYDQLEQKNLKRVDFVWVNRDYQAFEWFIELLGQLELQQLNSNQNERFIGIHLYMTSATMVQEIKPLDNPDFDKKGQIESKLDDFVLKLNPGRPNFDQLFEEIEKNKKGKVDVFFCGNRDFGRFVQKKCINHKFKFFKEYF